MVVIVVVILVVGGVGVVIVGGGVGGVGGGGFSDLKLPNAASHIAVCANMGELLDSGNLLGGVDSRLLKFLEANSVYDSQKQKEK